MSQGTEEHVVDYLPTELWHLIFSLPDEMAVEIMQLEPDKWHEGGEAPDNYMYLPRE